MAVESRMRRLGVLLMVVAAAGLFLASRPLVATAQDAALTVESQAQWAFAPSDAVPSLLTSEVPPGVICIVEPAACPEELDPITKDLLTPLLGEVVVDAEPIPVQLLPPGEIAVAIFAGAQRYMSGLKFALPAVAAGEEVDSFLVTFDETQPTYNYSSPLFRQAVLAAVAQAGTTDDFPATFQEEFQKGLANEDGQFPPVDPETRLGIEVCPFTEPFKPSTPPLVDSDVDIPRDESGGFAIDCLRGANGVFDASAGTWTFDLTFAAQAWASGELANHGVLFRNQEAENLAFGDPDVSSFFQTVLVTESAVGALVSSPPPPPLPSLPPPPASDGGTVSGPVVTQPPPSAVPPPSTDVAQPPQVAAPTQPPVASPPVEPVAAEITTPWWAVALLLLLFGAGWYLTAGALNATVDTVHARDGALANLTARSTTSPDPPTQV